MRRLGFVDAVGLVASATILMVLPGQPDPLTYSKLLVLSAGGLAILPFAVRRVIEIMRVQGRKSWLFLVPITAALLLPVWAAIGAILTADPWPVALFGWWGRGDGLLALLGAVSLMVAASTLGSRELQRLLTWLLGTTGIVVVVGLAQKLGVSLPPGASTGIVTSTMGNQNFAAGFLAISMPLTLAVLLDNRRANWQRIWASITLVLTVPALLWTESLQGPFAAAAGLVALAFAWLLGYHGARQTLTRWTAVAIGVTSLLVGLVTLAGLGPLGSLIAGQGTLGIRRQYWQTAIQMMESLPAFGSGIGSFGRYVSEFRPESYVALLGPQLRVSAAHNIVLHMGATLGWLGVALWLLVFLSALALAVVSLFRRTPLVVPVAAGVFGGLVAYLVQGMVSIDMLPLIAMGWLLAGMAVGNFRSSSAGSETKEDSPYPPRERAPLTRAHQRSTKGLTLTWICSLIAATCVASLVILQMASVSRLNSIVTQEEAVAALDDPLSPCPQLVVLSEAVLNQLPENVAVPALRAAAENDLRCPAMLTFLAQTDLAVGDLERADSETLLLTRIDPLFYFSWVLRGHYYLGVGDLESAQRSVLEARRTLRLYPDSSLGESEVVDLEERIREAMGNSGP